MKMLLTGGSKSGKSSLAQQLAVKLAGNAPKYYWAAMEPADGEDEQRILRHVEDRRGMGFETIERGRSLWLEKRELSDSAVLFDSVTALLANEMFYQGRFDCDAPQRCASELLQLSRRAGHIICVCDDIFRDGGEYEVLTEEFRRGLALVSRSLAAEFDTVCEVAAGLPKVIKGKMPY